MNTSKDFQLISIEKLVPYANNARKHSPAQINKIRASLREFGFINPVIIDKDCGIIAGHGRVLAAQAENISEVPCVLVDHLTEAQKKAYIIADNKLALDADWDEELLRLEIDYLKDLDFDVALTGFDETEFEDLLKDVSSSASTSDYSHRGKIAERFLFPPFSVLDARSKRWLDRKNFWIKDIGIKSSVSRENMKTTGSLSGTTPRYYDFKRRCEEQLGYTLSNKDFEENYLKDYLPKESIIASTEDGGILSTFDPVLAELMYYWFCPQGGSVLDPFAGGNVRGLVATLTEHDYTGVDIRQEQIDANIESAEQILNGEKMPKWICGDSVNIDNLVDGEFDMIFSCPPYFDLERYSDNPNDISNMSYEDFLKNYREIIAKTAKFLKNNRFAVFIVGDIRNIKTGMFRNFVVETIAAFQSSGLNLYNEMILVTQCGSLPLRVGTGFSTMRKVGKTHQNVLVFYKGNNQKEIKNDFGEVKLFYADEEEI